MVRVLRCSVPSAGSGGSTSAPAGTDPGGPRCSPQSPSATGTNNYPPPSSTQTRFPKDLRGMQYAGLVFLH